MQDHVSTEIAEELRKLSPEERVELGDKFSRLEEYPEWESFCDLAEAVRKRKLSALLASGKPREAAEYARDLGEINGLSIVDAIPRTVREKAQQADKELEARLAGAAAQEAR